MRISERLYSHPVIVNRDDVPEAAFQSTIEVKSDRRQVYIEVEAQCSSVTILDAVANGQAKFVLHEECSGTFFRQAFPFADSKTRIVVSADDLDSEIDVNCFATAVQDINAYQVEKAHPDYGDAVFRIRCGDTLAIGEGSVFEIESSDRTGKL